MRLHVAHSRGAARGSSLLLFLSFLFFLFSLCTATRLVFFRPHNITTKVLLLRSVVWGAREDILIYNRRTSRWLPLTSVTTERSCYLYFVKSMRSVSESSPLCHRTVVSVYMRLSSIPKYFKFPMSWEILEFTTIRGDWSQEIGNV